LAIWCVLGLLVGCDDAAQPAQDRDAVLPDAAVADAMVDLGVDAAPPDAMVVDAEPVDAAPLPTEPVEVRTELGAPSTEAGMANRVTCTVVDAAGVQVDDLSTRLEVRPVEGWIIDEARPDDLIGEVSGTYNITCTVPSLGLRDTTPERWDVLPGPASQLVTTAEPSTIDAGDSVTVGCVATDALGNPVDASAAEVDVVPLGAGTEVHGRVVTLRSAGRYRVGCRMAGVERHEDAVARVRPGLPAALVAGLEPLREVYQVGAVVGYPAIVTDAFGNTVPAADLVWGIDPMLPGFAEGRFLAEREGLYHVDVAVEGPTFDDRVLTAETSFVVDAGGPLLDCLDPPDGAMIQANPGAPATLRVGVADQLALARVTVDGEVARPDGAGVYVVDVPTHWGLNAHEVLAEDAAGNVSSRFCSRFVSAQYQAEDAAIADTITLHMMQDAIDDGAPDRPIDSLTDLVRRIIDSAGLLSTIDAGLRAQNPIVPNDCRARLPIIGSCLVRFGATYSSMQLGGPNPVSAVLVDGGLRVTARVNDIVLNARSTGTISTGIRINVSHVEVVMTFDVNLRNGRPNVQLRRTDQVTVGDVNVDLPGTIGDLFDGVVDLIFSAFEGLVRDEVAGAIRDFMSSEVDAMLGDVLSGLDLASLGLVFEVPSLVGGAPIPLSFDLDFSTLDTNAQRLLIGLSSVVNAPARQGRPSAGVPVPPGPARLEVGADGAFAAGIHLVFINQLMHRLWRAGLFDLDDAGGLLANLPDGVALSLQTLVPPAARGTGNGAEMELFFGPAVGALVYPGFFDEPLQVRVAARITASVALVEGAQLEFGALQVVDLKLGIDDAAIGAAARAAMEGDVRRIIQAVVDSALNDALPALPIPDFALPDGLAEFGVGAGTRLGLRGAQLRGTESHFVLEGRFAE
jgi:hypothetical protein